MTATTELRIERTFDAPRGRVFDAWSNPEVLQRWWGAGPGWTSPAVEVDLRTGGRYRLSMQDPTTDAVYTVSGEFLEVRRPERLVYTWSWDAPASAAGAPATTVSVEFVEVDGRRTTVLLTHTGFDDDRQCDLHDQGWKACLDNLAGRVLPPRS